MIWFIVLGFVAYLLAMIAKLTKERSSVFQALLPLKKGGNAGSTPGHDDLCTMHNTIVMCSV
jgi:hypothetical protein